MGIETPPVENHRLRKDQVTPPTQRFIVGVLRPAVGIKHVFWVVGSQFIYAAELNELLINAERQEQQKFNVSLAPLRVRAADPADWGEPGCIPGVPEFFLFLDVAVCVEVSEQLPLVQFVNLFLLRCTQSDKKGKSEKKSQHGAFGTAKKRREYTINPAENLYKVSDASEEYSTT